MHKVYTVYMNFYIIIEDDIDVTTIFTVTYFNHE